AGTLWSTDAGDTSAAGAHWIPLSLHMAYDKKDKLQVHEHKGDSTNGFHYTLSSVISIILDSRTSTRHLVAQVLVPTEYTSRRGGPHKEPSWLLLNDFTVLPISQFEAVHVANWKLPV